MTDNQAIILSVDSSAEIEVAKRAERLTPKRAPNSLGDLTTSVQFLRGVGSRATFALSSFYLLLAASIEGDNRCTVPGYPGKVLQSQVHFASLNTIALACRKAFDHGKGMTGAAFGRASDSTLEKHAEYWGRWPNRTKEDAYRALHFLRTFFAQCSKKPDALFKDGTTLGRRIGFVKQYADRSAAHLSLEHYEFDNLDLAHVVAALTLVGSIVYSFDNGHPPEYFNQIDQAAHDAAVALFPDAPRVRMFEDMQIDMQARLCWQWGEERGIQMLTEQLPYAVSWF